MVLPTVVDATGANLPATRETFAARLTRMERETQQLQAFFQRVMVPNHDYGIIPGTDKPTLLKPGAEKLAEYYDYAPVIKGEPRETADRETGFYRANVTVALVSKHSGEIVAEGVGEANTMEGRYRFRWMTETKLKQAGISPDGLESRQNKGRYGQFTTWKAENDDPWSLWNTVLKMAKKRALVDAVLSATRSSGLFTQDMEDLTGWIDGKAEAVDEETGETKERPAATIRTAPKSPDDVTPLVRLQRAAQEYRGGFMGLLREYLPDAVKPRGGYDPAMLIPEAIDMLLAILNQEPAAPTLQEQLKPEGVVE